MVLTFFWCLSILCSCICAAINSTPGAAAGALMDGAGTAIQVCISLAGPLALWSGLGKLMKELGFLGFISKILCPLWKRLFPSAKNDQLLRDALSANISANLLGLGNAATPMGIEAVQRMKQLSGETGATDEMCRLIVMNTASIQLLPTTVAALRASAGCETPFDILPCVWITSFLSVSAGLIACNLFRRVLRNV